MSVIVIAVASGIAVWLVRQTFVWTPLQQFYLSAYARGAVASSLGIRTGRYRVLLMETPRGSRLAIDDEVVPVTLGMLPVQEFLVNWLPGSHVLAVRVSIAYQVR